MSTVIKTIGSGQLPSTQANIGNAVQSSPPKTYLVKNIILVNGDTAPKTVTLWYKPSGGTARQILVTSITAGARYIFTSRISMEAGDQLQGAGGGSTLIDYMINGIERDP